MESRDRIPVARLDDSVGLVANAIQCLWKWSNESLSMVLIVLPPWVNVRRCTPLRGAGKIPYDDASSQLKCWQTQHLGTEALKKANLTRRC